MRRVATVLAVVAAFALLAAGAAGSRPKGHGMDQQDAVKQALISRDFIRETPNTAHAPREPGSPDFLFSATVPPTGGNIIASGVTEYAVARVTFDDVDSSLVPFDDGTIILDAKVYVEEGFDGGADNTIAISLGDSTILGGGIKSVFANAYDVSQRGGAAVTGMIPFFGDTPQFLPQVIHDPTAVFVDYGYTGDDPTTGSALVVLTVARPAA